MYIMKTEKKKSKNFKTIEEVEEYKKKRFNFT